MTAIDTSTEAVERLASDHQTVGDTPVRFSIGYPHHWHTAAVLRQLVKERDEARAALAASQPADPVTNAGCRQPVQVKPLEPAPVTLAEAEGHWEDFLKSAVAEAEKAMRKFPQPNYVISKVAEEAGEVVKAAIHCAEARETAENVRNEMRQLIAMLYRLWVEGDQVHGLPPVSTAALRAIGEGE